MIKSPGAFPGLAARIRPARKALLAAAVTAAAAPVFALTVPANAAPPAGSVAVPAKSAPAAAPAAVPAPAPPGGEVGLGNTGSPANGQAPSPSAVCLFYTKGDYVHISSTAFEASGHGWWVNVDCPATWAVVTVQLQEYYSDGSWRNKGTVGRATVLSGGGAGNRATGRAGCSNSSLTGWRSVIDVDLVNLADDPGKLTTPAQNIYCRQ